MIMAKKIVTLFVDDSCLRVLVIQGQKVKKWGELPLEPELIKGNMVLNAPEVVGRIKQLFKEQKINATKVILGLSGLHCLTRPVTLPQLPNEMLPEAVAREARRVLPVPLEQLYLSWQLLPISKEESRLFMVAIPRRIADAIIAVLHQAGLKPSMIDLKPLALARVVREPTAIVVDIQPTEFDIVTLVDGMPQPVRTIPFPNEDLSSADKLLLIKSEMGRTVEFFNSNNRDKPLSPDVPLFLSGGLVEEPGLCQALCQLLGRPVIPLTAPLPEELNSRYLVNVGLALKEMTELAGPALPNVNCLPEPYRPKPISLVRVVVLPAAVVVVSAVVVLALVVQNTAANIDSLKSRLNDTNLLLAQRLLQKEKLEKEVTQMEAQLVSAEGSVETLNAVGETISFQGEQINGDMRTAYNDLLDTTTLLGMAHVADGMTILGTAPREVDVLIYARNLDFSNRFNEVVVNNLTYQEEGYYKFILALKLKE